MHASLSGKGVSIAADVAWDLIESARETHKSVATVLAVRKKAQGHRIGYIVCGGGVNFGERCGPCSGYGTVAAVGPETCQGRRTSVRESIDLGPCRRKDAHVGVHPSLGTLWTVKHLNMYKDNKSSASSWWTV